VPYYFSPPHRAKASYNARPSENTPSTSFGE
jgi:hypothetical protein